MSGNSADLPQSTIYLGVSSPEKQLSLKDVSFYFEQQDTKLDTLFYHHLKNAEWFDVMVLK